MTFARVHAVARFGECGTKSVSLRPSDASTIAVFRLESEAELSVRPAAGPSHFLLGGQEKVTKEKATPGQSLSGHSALRVRVRLPGLLDGTPMYRSSNTRTSCSRPFGLFLQPPADRQRPHWAAILAAAQLRPRTVAKPSARVLEGSPRATPVFVPTHSLGANADAEGGPRREPRASPMDGARNNAAEFGSKAHMFEHMDVRARLLRSCAELSLGHAGPKSASSAGHSVREASAARTPGRLSLGYFSLATQREVTRADRRSD